MYTLDYLFASSADSDCPSTSELRNSLDNLRLETEGQASSHLTLTQNMRRELETPSSEFVAKLAHHKKTAYTSIEKAFKVKQAQEAMVAKVSIRHD